MGGEASPGVGPGAVAAGSVPRWQAGWLNLRNRFLAAPGFQRWAAGFPLVRRRTRQRTRDLFDLCAGFVYSQVLFACIDLGVFEHLGAGPRTLADLAPRLGLPESGALRLLKSAEALGLVERCGAGHYALGVLGAVLNGNPAIVAMVRHHVMLYRDLQDPVALLRGARGTEISAYWPYAHSPAPKRLVDASIRDYTALMADSQSLISGDILDAYPLRGHRRLLDLGGGSGAFLAAAAARWSHLELGLFDLPAVAVKARARFERDGLAGRVEVNGGDLFRDPLPAGADLISLVRVVHDHDDGPVMALLGAARQALPDGGVLLLAEPMSGTPGAEPVGEAYFGFYLLAMGSGRPRTGAELTAMLCRSGFAAVREVPTRRPLLTRLLVAAT